MTGARVRVLIFFIAAALAAAVFAVATLRRQPGVSPELRRPTLLLLTGLPLIFNEDFSLKGGSAALKALQAHYRVVPISVASPRDLAEGGLLLLAHPPAQTAENLVALDDWVRGGGRVLLFADPLLEWPSTRPVGDPLRPAPMFMDTGLLSHWGLRLEGPDRRGLAERELGGLRVVTASPGKLSGRCRIATDRLVAECHVGKGWAIVVADADLLNVEVLASGANHNLDALTAELAMLRQK